jgi:hypothetical protein
MLHASLTTDLVVRATYTGWLSWSKIAAASTCSLRCVARSSSIPLTETMSRSSETDGQRASGTKNSHIFDKRTNVLRSKHELHQEPEIYHQAAQT